MATQRTLKLNLLADVDKFGRGLNKAGKDAQGFGGKVKKYGKIAAGALAAVAVAAGAMAIKLGVDAVKGAMEDEISQKKLAKALQNTTKATDKQVASAEEYITKQQLQYGIADTKLRPALANLARATGSLTTAQKLNNLAIDISASTGKDLETVSVALSKGYNGNLGALKKLGIPLDENIIKTKDFGAATDVLQKLFGGAAAANTETLQGKLAILKETFGELQENVGVKFIPILKRLADKAMEVSKAFSGQDPEGLSTRARELKGEMGDTGAGSLGRSIKILADSFGQLFLAFSSDNGDTSNFMQDLADSLNAVAGAIRAVAKAYKFGKGVMGNLVDTIVMGEGKAGYASGLPGLSIGAKGSKGGGRAAGGSVMANKAYRVGEFGSEIFIPSGSGSIRKDPGSGGNTFIFNGVIDGESARRSIERIMQASTRRTGAVNLAGAQL
jgi:hypothetical protein